MKIVRAKEMGRIEHLAYEQGASEEQFMLNAGGKITEAIQQFVGRFHLKPRIVLLCGRGNNAGDAYVAGKLLQEGGFTVRAFALSPQEESSPLCQLQSRRFCDGGGEIVYVSAPNQISFDDSTLLIDGILGTGFHGKIEGLFREMILSANQSGLPIVSIDIPSGINGNTGEIGGVAIKAKQTLFLGLPKVGCFLGDAWNYVGEIALLDFGLGAEYIDEAEEEGRLINESLIRSLFPPVVRTRHKYEAGYVVGVGGSPGMPGAPVMTCFAALRSGAGIVRLFHPEGMEGEFASAPCEVIRQGYHPGRVAPILEGMERASATFIGPGLGTSSAAEKTLQRLLPELNKPCVLDAEALTLLAKHEIPLPKKAILTPHQGEMHRLLHAETKLSISELVEKTHRYAEEKRVTVVLKGAPTFIFHPGTSPHVCARGNPGMATAGSGDVLTGILSAFLAQTQDPFQAAILGVYIHALAGEIAAEETTAYCMVATDITAALPQAFKQFA
ncbi:MAG: Bifunctional NAD(P)H-hydrate repair enzyme Nnr [Chlamydiae bacterium]|nr:Bifunctional NAD(P)H-hydrate repair enzyme Nnr [Chlamydiota bacterium]